MESGLLIPLVSMLSKSWRVTCQSAPCVGSLLQRGVLDVAMNGTAKGKQHIESPACLVLHLSA